ncbi:CAP domain-containing protein [Micromonospora sp. WMMD987]|uniref:CAP domain-containing protein n=1 Tax=Micromonospora sp. WMMD987 TaxID=3016089 RepID=UPI00249C6D46|nr:CAP domain-containing protein [Micromonospora sp. WMMD987]WFE96852.1 CAP domain-containing protein [Micromonospora sp. WMMD987]
MYGSTDPNDPDAAYRRPQPSADDPAWLTDRPEPRSAYLFGDDPVHETPGHHAPTHEAPGHEAPGHDGPAHPHSGGRSGGGRDRWDDHGGPAHSTPSGDAWADSAPGRQPTEPTARWRDQQVGQGSAGATGRWRDEPTGQWTGEPTGQWGAAGRTGSRPDAPTGPWPGEQAEPWRSEQTGQWHGEQSGPWPGGEAEPWRDEQTGQWHGEHDDAQAGRWHGEQTGQWADEHAGQWHGERAGQWHDDQAGQWAGEQTGRQWAGEQTGQWHGEPAGQWDDGTAGVAGRPGPWGNEADGRTADRAGVAPWSADPEPDATALAPAVVPVGGRPSTNAPARPRRRLKRPLLIGGAAATATLAVSLGVGALMLPDDGPTDRAALDEPVATAPVVSDTGPATTAPASPSPSASPSPATASPSPSPSRTATPTPAPSRTEPASRRTTRGGDIPTAAPTTRAAVSGGGGGSQTQQVVDLVNAERAKAGCAAVTVDEKLTLAAQRHSQDQADHKTMTHTGSDGSDAGQRLDRAGYSWRTYGENVAWNQPTPAAVMNAWMNSSGHRANILNCAFTEIGVGVANGNGPYWTQDFAAPR